MAGNRNSLIHVLYWSIYDIWIISCVCIVEDTVTLIAGNVSECASWSAWKNWDTPAGTGDKEIPINANLPDNCKKTAIQGRIVENNEMITSQKVQISLEGLTCLNANQIGDDCVDYEVRLCCEGKLNSVFERFTNVKKHMLHRICN